MSSWSCQCDSSCKWWSLILPEAVWFKHTFPTTTSFWHLYPQASRSFGCRGVGSLDHWPSWSETSRSLQQVDEAAHLPSFFIVLRVTTWEFGWQVNLSWGTVNICISDTKHVFRAIRSQERIANTFWTQKYGLWIKYKIKFIWETMSW